LLLLRPHLSGEVVSPATLMAVPKTLLENGLIEAASFDRFRQKEPA
jgi:hypothetical protein